MYCLLADLFHPHKCPMWKIVLSKVGSTGSQRPETGLATMTQVAELAWHNLGDSFICLAAFLGRHWHSPQCEGYIKP